MLACSYTMVATCRWRTGEALPFRWTNPLSNSGAESVAAKKDLDSFLARQRILRNGPLVYTGTLTVGEVGDTYLNMAGWGKGVAYVNGFNLGRYWPVAGPQVTLYVPNEVLKVGENSVVILEYQRANKTTNGDDLPAVQFDAVAQLDGQSGEVALK